MPKYLIEREIPNAGALSADELKDIAQRSCAAYSRGFPVCPNDAACAAACCRSGAALNASD